MLLDCDYFAIDLNPFKYDPITDQCMACKFHYGAHKRAAVDIIYGMKQIYKQVENASKNIVKHKKFNLKNGVIISLIHQLLKHHLHQSNI